MNGRDIEFASLLCSRLCHDLMSPVGAFGNGLELLADEDDAELRAQYIDLLEASARASTAKLKFFRLAFGAAGGMGEAIPTAETRAALEGMFADRKGFELGWLVEAATLPKASAKVLLNLALIAGDALLRGGRLDIGAEGGELVIRAEGSRLKLDDEIRAALLGGIAAGAPTPRNAAALLVYALSGGTVQVSEPGEGVLMMGATVGAA